MKKVSTKSVPSESAEQIALVIRLRLEGIPFYGVPNGADVEPHHRGRLVAEGLEAGVSDLVILKHKDALYLEMKRIKGSKWGDDQKAWKEKVEKLGFKYEVAKGAKEAWAIIQEFLTPTHS